MDKLMIILKNRLIILLFGVLIGFFGSPYTASLIIPVLKDCMDARKMNGILQGTNEILVDKLERLERLHSR